MAFRFYIVYLPNGEVIGTDVFDHASEYTNSEEYVVIDVDGNKAVVLDSIVEIEEQF